MKKPEPKCPYCGTEMRIFTKSICNMILTHGYAVCPECGSTGPCVIPEDVWDMEGNQLREAVKEETLRRPIQKPLTLKELHALIDSGDEVVIYIETDTHVETYANIIYGMKIFDRYGETEGVDFLRFETYGKTWRAWATRPTDEERAAAPWEE